MNRTQRGSIIVLIVLLILFWPLGIAYFLIRKWGEEK